MQCYAKAIFLMSYYYVISGQHCTKEGRGERERERREAGERESQEMVNEYVEYNIPCLSLTISAKIRCRL